SDDGDGDDDDAMMTEILDNCSTKDDDHATEQLTEEEEDNVRMDSGFMNESKENDHHSLHMDERSTDCESMGEEEGDVLYEHEYQKSKAVKQLVAVFELLKIESIHDKSTVFPIRVKVDEVYRKLQQWRDVLEGVTQASHDPNPHELRISESNEFLDGLKKLFVESDANEKIRLMTIAPREW
ncbi:unnamed protein product, partial [Adineta ricciae]